MLARVGAAGFRRGNVQFEHEAAALGIHVGQPEGCNVMAGVAIMVPVAAIAVRQRHARELHAACGGKTCRFFTS